MELAVEREEPRKGENRTVFRANGGVGLSYSFAPQGLVYGFVEPALKAGSGLDKGYALGALARAGLLKSVTRKWKAQFEIGVESFGQGDGHTVLSAELNQTFSVNRDNAVNVNLRRERFDGFYSTEALLGWSAYF